MDDQLKQRLMPAVIVFNFTLVAYILVKVFYPVLIRGRAIFFGDLMTHVLIGAGIGLVTGGIVFGLMMMKK